MNKTGSVWKHSKKRSNLCAYRRQAMQQVIEKTEAVEKDFLPLNGTDYVEFYVGNARQAAHYYRSAFGMELVAYRGPETGTRDRASYLLQQNKIRSVLTTPLQPDDP